MLTEKMKEELKNIFEELFELIETIRGYIYSNKNMPEKIWEQINSRNFELTDKIENMIKQIDSSN